MSHLTSIQMTLSTRSSLMQAERLPMMIAEADAYQRAGLMSGGDKTPVAMQETHFRWGVRPL